MSRTTSLAAAFAAALLALPASAAVDRAAPAALKDRYGDLRARLEQNAFGRPLAIDSAESGDALRGDAYAVVSHPFAKVREALSSPGNWCQILTLPFNVQKCESGRDSVELHIGRKPESPLDEATRLDLRFALVAKGDDALHVELTARTGPAGTRDYRLSLVAVPLGAERTLVQFGYGYSSSLMARLALQTYLATSGSQKVGFTTENDESGKPRLVGGVRGVVERNTMRYYLAIEAFLDAFHRPESERRRATLEHWFSAVEKYPRQLKEMSREKYLALKLPPAA